VGVTRPDGPFVKRCEIPEILVVGDFSIYCKAGIVDDPFLID
jgi:hypothetical protein